MTEEHPRFGLQADVAIMVRIVEAISIALLVPGFAAGKISQTPLD